MKNQQNSFVNARRAALWAAAPLVLLMASHAQAAKSVGTNSPDINPCASVTSSMLGADVMNTEIGEYTLLSRDNIHYSSSGTLEVALTLPTCSSVTQISMRGTTLQEATQILIDPPAMYYHIESDYPLGDGTHRVTVQLHFNNNHWGDSYPVTIAALNPSNAQDQPAQHKMTVVGVKKLPGLDTIMSFSDSELDNLFNQKIFDIFGPNNSATMNLDGKDYTVYNSSYNPVSLAGDGRIGFHWNFKVEQNNFCDLKLSAGGGFTIEPVLDVNDLDEDGSSTDYVYTSVWRDEDGNEVDGPDTVADLSTYCVLALPLISLFKAENQFRAITLAEDAVRTLIAEMVSEKIASMVNEFDCDATGTGLTCDALIGDIQPEFRMLNIKLALLPTKVVIDVPYGNRHQTSPQYYGFALNPGDKVAVIGSGAASVCGNLNYGAYPACLRGDLSANGLPNVNVDDGALQPRHRMERNLAQLPIPDANVGALVARQVDAGIGIITIPGIHPQYINTGIDKRILLNNLNVLQAPRFSYEGSWLFFDNNEKYNSGMGVYGSGTLQATIVFVN